MKSVLTTIKGIREEKGYSHEYMAHMLDLSQVAYTKLEKGQTKLTLERLYKIAEILEVEVGNLLDIESNNQLNQTNKDYSTGYLQQIENFHQENKDQNEKIVTLYEARLKDKDLLIEELKRVIDILKK